MHQALKASFLLVVLAGEISHQDATLTQIPSEATNTTEVSTKNESETGRLYTVDFVDSALKSLYFTFPIISVTYTLTSLL